MMKNEILPSQISGLREKGLSAEDAEEVLHRAARHLCMPVPFLVVNHNRQVLRGLNDEQLHKISVPVRSLEHSMAFGIYSLVHQMVHLACPERCNGSGWRGRVHSDRFHNLEAAVMLQFGVCMKYRPENHQCELQDLDGNHICDGLGQ